MARIRSIKPEFWTSGQVLECSWNARLLFIGLWNFCDDAGRHPLKPKQIKAEIFPADEIASENILGMIKELSENGLLATYIVDNQEYLQITGWHHQRIDKPQPAKYPSPPAPPENHSKNDPRTFPPDTIRYDRKGKETFPDGKDAEKSAHQEMTDTVWRNCPAKLKQLGVTENSARSFIGKCLKQAKPEIVLKAIDAAAKCGTRDPQGYVMGVLRKEDNDPDWEILKAL